MNDSTSTVLITGASSGIGYELAKLFAKDRHNLVLVARSGSRLAQVADELQRQFAVKAMPVTLDLAVPSAPQSLFDQLGRHGITVDILINNAGYGKFGEFAQLVNTIDEFFQNLAVPAARLARAADAIAGMPEAAVGLPGHFGGLADFGDLEVVVAFLF